MGADPNPTPRPEERGVVLADGRVYVFAPLTFGQLDRYQDLLFKEIPPGQQYARETLRDAAFLAAVSLARHHPDLAPRRETVAKACDALALQLADDPEADAKLGAIRAALTGAIAESPAGELALRILDTLRAAVVAPDGAARVLDLLDVSNQKAVINAVWSMNGVQPAQVVATSTGGKTGHGMVDKALKKLGVETADDVALGEASAASQSLPGPAAP